MPRDEHSEKVFGKFTYVQDVKVPGMVRARRPAADALGSTLASKVDGFPER